MAYGYAGMDMSEFCHSRDRGRGSATFQQSHASFATAMGEGGSATFWQSHTSHAIAVVIYFSLIILRVGQSALTCAFWRCNATNQRQWHAVCPSLIVWPALHGPLVCFRSAAWCTWISISDIPSLLNNWPLNLSETVELIGGHVDGAQPCRTDGYDMPGKDVCATWHH